MDPSQENTPAEVDAGEIENGAIVGPTSNVAKYSPFSGNDALRGKPTYNSAQGVVCCVCTPAEKCPRVMSWCDQLKYAIVCPSLHVNPTNGRTWIAVHPECVRLTAYIAFWSMVLFAVAMTQIFVRPNWKRGNFDTSTDLVAVFGYNNICVNWDYTPARELTSWVYPLVELPLVTYIVLNTLRSYQLSKRNPSSGLNMPAIFAMSIISFFGCYYFRQIFVFQVTEGPQGVAGHTSGFYILMIALVLTSIENHMFDTANDSMPLNGKFNWLNTAYVWVLAIVTAIKVVYGAVCIIRYATGAGPFSNAVVGTIFRFFDGVWMLLAAVIPVFLSMISMANTECLVATI